MKLKNLMNILQTLIDSGAALEEEEIEVAIFIPDNLGDSEEYYEVYGVTVYNNGGITLKAIDVRE